MASPSSLFQPDLLKKLSENPHTAHLVHDEELKTILKDIEKNPNKLGTHLQNPKLMKAIGELANSTNANTTNPSSSKSYDPSHAQHIEKKHKLNPEPHHDLATSSKKGSNTVLAEKEKEAGNVAYKAKNFDVAIANYTRAMELNPNNMIYLTNRAAAKLEKGDYDGCIADCQQAIQDNNEKHLHSDFKVIARAYQRIGSAYLKKQNIDKAIDFLEKSLIEHSDNNVQQKLNEAKALKKNLDDQAYINPELSTAARAKGNEFFKKGDFPKAIKYYTDAIKRNPNDPAPYSNRAAAYTKLGEFRMGLKDCDKCLEIDPKFLKAYSRKGAIHFFMKEYHKCMDIFKNGLEIDPNNEEMKRGLRETTLAIQKQQMSGDVDEQQLKHAMDDPEIQQILMDPTIQQALKVIQESPEKAHKYTSDPQISAKINKLVASGVLRVK